MNTDVDALVDTLTEARIIFGMPSAETREEHYRVVSEHFRSWDGKIKGAGWIARREVPVFVERDGERVCLWNVESIGSRKASFDDALAEMRAAVRRALESSREFSWMAGTDAPTDEEAAEIMQHRRQRDEW